MVCAPFNEWKSKQTPFVQQYNTDIAFNRQVKVRHPIHDFARNKKKEEFHAFDIDAPEADETPGVNKYDTVACIEKT